MARHSRSFEAQWGGRCGICDDEIEPGDEACFYDGELCHTGCAESE